MNRIVVTFNDQILDIIDLKGIFSGNLIIIVDYVYIERERERKRDNRVR